MTIPSPADLAARIRGFRGDPSVGSLLAALQKRFPHIVRTVERVDGDLLGSLHQWIDEEGIATVAQWIEEDSPAMLLVGNWSSRRSPGHHALLASLVKEHQLSRQGDAVGAYFRSSGTSYARSLRSAQRAVAAALIEQVFEIPFHKPVVLVRAANLARQYLQALIDTDESAEPTQAQRDRRDFGMMVVTSARFSTVPGAILETAREYLREATERTLDPTAATCYVEASLELYQTTGDGGVLKEVATWIGQQTDNYTQFQKWHLRAGEVWLHLIEHAATGAGCQRFLERAKSAFDRAAETELELPHEVTLRMLSAIASYYTDRPDRIASSSLHGLRLPFGLRITNIDLPRIVFDAGDYIADSLYPAAERGTYVYRDALADLLSYLGRQDIERERVTRLREAIRLRNPVGRKEALGGARSNLAQAQDYLLLAQTDGASNFRLRGIEVLFEQHLADSSAPAPLVLLATDIEHNGRLEQARAVEGIDVELLRAVRSGDAETILRMAARRALASSELRRRGLGGRGGVVTVDDHSGMTGQTFILKEMSLASHSRDLSRASFLSESLRDAGLDNRFGVVEHLMSEHMAEHDSGVDHVISVRRYLSGKTLRAAIAENTRSRDKLLGACVEFLAFIHARESRLAPCASGRREIKTKELGRWLKSVTSTPDQSFEAWWELVSDAPMLPRRDAHSLNWLVGSGARILAVDLESTGSRPAMYELAQLVDDSPVYLPDDWRARNELSLLYLRELERNGFVLDAEVGRKAFDASTAARAVGLLTHPSEANSLRLHGFQLLREISTTSDFPDVRSWAQQIADSWSIKAGLSDPTRFSSISPADRVRISKAMAFHLRHNVDALVTRGGWMFAEDLAELLRASGHRVTPEQLLVVAGAMGEKRFELDGFEIRARYGHSVDRRIEYTAATPPRHLFHATTSDGLGSIFEARAGLLPMKRTYVHLSDSPATALQAAARRDSPVHLLRVRPERIKGLVFAGANTWLATAVPASSLEVLTQLERAALAEND